MGDAMEVEQADAPPQVLRFSLDILDVTNEARSTYGLRHQDYQRYRRFCAAKLDRLRETLRFSYAGKGRSFQKKDITPDVVTDVRHLHLILFDAERAWSYAMELKRESRSGGDPRKRQHAIKRLRKAAKIAEHLERVCSQDAGKVDARTSLEVQAYAALMTGYLLFEKQSWQSALDKFAAARTIYEKISTAGTSHQEALCQSAIDDIDPNIRYCGYKLRLGTEGETDVEDLVKMTMGQNKFEVQIEGVISQTRQKTVSINSITWRGRSAPLKNADVAVSVLRAREAAAELDRMLKTEAEEDSRVELFDKVLEAYGDAERAAKNALKEDASATAKIKSSRSEQNTANLNFVYTYVAYQHICRRIQRELMLVASRRRQLERQDGAESGRSAGGKYQDIVKLYDNVLQSLTEIKNLPAVMDNHELAQEIEAKTWYFKAQRTLYVASAYASVHRPGEAVLLYDRAREYNTQARSTLRGDEDSEGEVLVVSGRDADELESVLRGLRCKARAAWHLERVETAGEEDVVRRVRTMSLDDRIKVEGAPLADRLDEYPSNLSLTNPRFIDFPPAFVAVPAKPLFFDIASEHIQYPARLAQRAGKKQGSRIGDLLSTFWGGK